MALTITEALAEIKTTQARILKKRTVIQQNVARHAVMVDPFASEGGSKKYIEQEQQSVRDLEERVITLRRAIAKANEEYKINIDGTVRTIAEWITWKRDIVPGLKIHISSMLAGIAAAKEDVKRRGGLFVDPDKVGTGDEAMTQVVMLADEPKIIKQNEQLEELLGRLDGQLSLKNATITLDV
jgi:hypothetical protein